MPQMQEMLLEEPDAVESLVADSRVCQGAAAVGACTCQVDLDLLAEHVQWQVLHRRSDRAPGVVDQRIQPAAAHPGAHLLQSRRNLEAMQSQHGGSACEADERDQASRLVAVLCRDSNDLMGGCSDAVCLRDVQHERRDVAMRRSCSLRVCRPPHPGVHAPALCGSDFTCGSARLLVTLSAVTAVLAHVSIGSGA